MRRVGGRSVQLTGYGRTNSFVNRIVRLRGILDSDNSPTARGPTQNLGLKDIELVRRTSLSLRLLNLRDIVSTQPSTILVDQNTTHECLGVGASAKVVHLSRLAA